VGSSNKPWQKLVQTSRENMIARAKAELAEQASDLILWRAY
jgi:hypothetical protein